MNRTGTTQHTVRVHYIKNQNFFLLATGYRTGDQYLYGCVILLYPQQSHFFPPGFALDNKFQARSQYFRHI